MDHEINFDEMSSDRFLVLSKSFSVNQIACIFEKLYIINDFYKIEIPKFNAVFSKCNIETQDKLILNIDIEYLLELFEANLITFSKINNNANIYKDLNEFIYKVYCKKLLGKLLNSMNDNFFKKILNEIHFYNLIEIYKIIEGNDKKKKIFINSIQPNYLNLLISYFDMSMIKFVSNHINYIIKLEYIGNLFILNESDLDNITLSKLQIILLLGSSSENIVINSILVYEIDFIRVVINELRIENFKSIFLKIRIDQLHEIIEFIDYNKLLSIIDFETNPLVINRILGNIPTYNLIAVIEKLSINQIIISIYDLNEDIIIFISNNLTNIHYGQLLDIFNRIYINDINNVLPLFSKQLIAFLFKIQQSKRYIISNFSNLKYDQILLLLKLMNGDDIYNILKLSEFNRRSFILSALKDDQVNMLNYIVDRKLDILDVNNTNNIREKILIKSISMFIKLKLLPHNDIKLKQII